MGLRVEGFGFGLWGSGVSGASPRFLSSSAVHAFGAEISTAYFNDTGTQRLLGPKGYWDPKASGTQRLLGPKGFRKGCTGLIVLSDYGSFSELGSHFGSPIIKGP